MHTKFALESQWHNWYMFGVIDLEHVRKGADVFAKSPHCWSRSDRRLTIQNEEVIFMCAGRSELLKCRHGAVVSIFPCLGAGELLAIPLSAPLLPKIAPLVPTISFHTPEREARYTLT